MIDFLVYLLTIGGIWGMLSLSLNVQFGIAGLINLGHVAFFMLGAYVSTILVVLNGWDITFGIFAGGAAAAAFGMLMALPTARLQQDYWAISTLAVAEILRIFFLNTSLNGPFVGQALGVSGIPRPLRGWFSEQGYSIAAYNWFFLGLVMACLVATLLFCLWLSRTPFARTLKALREDDAVPLALGKRVSSFRIRAMAIGGAIGGLAGGLFAHYNAFIEPEYFRPIETFLIWAMVILGGAGNMIGSLVGTLLVMTLYNSSRFVPGWLNDLFGWTIDGRVYGSLRLVLIGVIIILVILYLPNGLLPERRRKSAQ